MKKIKKLISILLAAVMICSLFTIVPSASAQSDPGLSGTSAVIDASGTSTEDGSESSKPPAYDPKKATVGQYSIDQIDSTLLVRHTGKSSELIDQGNKNRDARDASAYSAEEYDETFFSLSCDDNFYSDLGFEVSDLKSKAKSYASNGELTNPLAGLGYIDPNELLVGSCNASSDFCTYFNTYDNAQVSDPKDLKDKITDNAQNTDEYFFKDDDGTWNVQCSNGIGLDADGDGLDEFAYFSLIEKEDDTNDQKAGSYIRVQLYDRVMCNGSYVWSLVDDYRLVMTYNNYVYGYIPVEADLGYMPLAAGDYDGDGCEELAYYMADKGGDNDANDARVVIRKYSHDGGWSGSTLAQIYLKNIKDDLTSSEDSDYAKMGGFSDVDKSFGYILPTVTLSTTSTRLKDMVNENAKTNSAKRYTTYDDLVINVSVPNAYYDSHVNNNSTTEIYGMQNGSIGRLFHYEYLPFLKTDNNDILDGYYRRMTGVNTCDADLNGDGFKEIFAAGWVGSITPDESAYRTDDTDVNHQSGATAWYMELVNIISYNPDAGTYEMIWDTPVQLAQDKDTTQGLYPFEAISPPVAVCAGHFLTEAPSLKDQVCVNGAVYDLANTLMTGKPLYYSYQTDGTKTSYIADTLPGYDKLNFPLTANTETGAGGVVFNEKFVYDPEEAGITKASCNIRTLVTGRYFTNSEVDQIAVVTWDFDSWILDVWMDITIISDTASGWSYKAYNNIIDERPTGKHGTSLFTACLDVEEDCAVYRWMGAYCSYSAPTPYAVLQAPPYYKEANSMYTYEYGIVQGNTSDSAEDMSIGFCISGETEAEFLGGTLSVGIGGDMAISKVKNTSWSEERETERSWAVEPGEDLVICTATPIVVNIYEVYQKKPSAEELEASDAAYDSDSEEGRLDRTVYQISTPQEPVFVSLPIETYNAAIEKAAEQYQEENGTLDPRDSAPIISPDSLPQSSGGDPAGYNHTYDAAFAGITYDKSITKCGSLSADVTNDSNEEMVANRFEFGYGSSLETGVAVDGGLHAKIGAKAGKKAEASIEPGITAEKVETSGTGTTEGTTFLVTYFVPRADKQILGGLTYGSETYNKTTDPAIMHYNPATGTWYDYTAYAECYCYTSYKDDHDKDHDIMAMSFYTTMKDGQKEDNQTIYENGNYVQNPTPAQLDYLYPPEPPEEFSVQSMEYDADGKGSFDVTLVWRSENRNSARKADGYNIYMSDADANSSTTIHLQNKDGLITPLKNSAYTTASFHFDQGDYPEEDINFYIVPVYLEDQNGALYAVEGTIGGQTTIADPYASGKGMIIKKQPRTYWMHDDNQNETATFTIEAVKDEEFLSTADVTFLWQEYNEETKTWDKLDEQSVADTGSTSDDPQVFKSSYTYTIEGTKKADFVDKGVRCIVGCSNFSKTSDVVSFYYLNENCVLTGDADSSGAVDIVDTTVIQRYLSMSSVTDAFSETAADVDSDDMVTIIDATLIQRWLADMEVDYPIGEYVFQS